MTRPQIELTQRGYDISALFDELLLKNASEMVVRPNQWGKRAMYPYEWESCATIHRLFP